MRALILVLLLVLTPLRAWSADSMAVRMAAQGAGQGMAGDAQAHDASMEALSEHCAGMAASLSAAAPDLAPATDDEDRSDRGDPCPNCAACQVCATVALPAPMGVCVGTCQSHHLPCTAVPAFSSAELAPSQKPPIS
ncbi:MAG: hypothetical protein CFE44_05520 [Burkholderiales bacterium PBB4]|nr:MAG: hypothetical protein CFE44_05520 [Burkholderiales bacterium PBB4]